MRGRMVTTGFVVFLLVLLVSFPGHTEEFGEDSEFIQSLKSGEVSANFRFSYERSDLENNGTPPGNSLTVRSRLDYRSKPYKGFQLFAQPQNVTAIQDHYSPEDPNNDAVVDPGEDAMHQLYIDYQGEEGTLLRLGRQEVILQTARLVGNVGWRQNAQSFDAATLHHQFDEDVTVRAGYVDQIKTIRDQRSDPDHFMILEGQYDGFDEQTLNVYSYLLDMPGGTVNDRDKATYGVRLNGSIAGFDYDVDVAIQEGYQDADTDAGSMVNGTLHRSVGDVVVGVGYNKIEGADGNERPFDTLVGTAHKFNGWTDQFLGTNGGLATGLEDRYAELKTTLAGYTFLTRYHDFEQETSGNAYGEEFDAVVKKQFYEDLNGLVKYGKYDADTNNTSGTAQNDEDVFWVRLNYSL